MRGIARLAQELGISTGTVSRALNGKPDVNAETRRKVLDAAQRLGYAANQAARTLAQGTTRSIGFIIDLDPESAASSDYFFMGVFDGVQSVLSPHGLDLLVLPCPTDKDPFAYLQRIAARGVVDGMILSGTKRVDPRIDHLIATRIPFVTLGRSSTGRDYSWIDLDFEGVVATAMQRFFDLGHRRVALTVPHGDVNFGAIFEDTYRAALASRGIPFDPDLVIQTRRSEEAGYAIVDRLFGLDDAPTAVLLMYEVTAIGVYRRLGELGLRPGHDLAVIGSRDEPTVRFLTPSVTCFGMSRQELGVTVGEALLAQLPGFADRYPGGLVQKRTPLTLRPGESDRFGPRPMVKNAIVKSPKTLSSGSPEIGTGATELTTLPQTGGD